MTYFHAKIKYSLTKHIQSHNNMIKIYHEKCLRIECIHRVLLPHLMEGSFIIKFSDPESILMRSLVLLSVDSISSLHAHNVSVLWLVELLVLSKLTTCSYSIVES